MPTYQYACTACGAQLETVQKFTDDPLTECSSCGGRLRKVFSAVGVVFKGSGFYRTDSRSESTKKSESKEHSGSDGDKTAKESSPTGKDGSGSTGSSDSGSSNSSGKGESGEKKKSTKEKVA